MLTTEWINNARRVNRLKEKVVEGLKMYFKYYREIAFRAPKVWQENPEEAKMTTEFFIELLENISALGEEGEFKAILDPPDFGLLYTIEGRSVEIVPRSRELLGALGAALAPDYLDLIILTEIRNFIDNKKQYYDNWVEFKARRIISDFAPLVVKDNSDEKRFVEAYTDRLKYAMPGLGREQFFTIDEVLAYDEPTVEGIPINVGNLVKLNRLLGESFVNDAPKLDLKLLDWSADAPQEITITTIPLTTRERWNVLLVKGRKIGNAGDFVVSGWFVSHLRELADFCHGNGKLKELYEQIVPAFVNDPQQYKSRMQYFIEKVFKPYIRFWVKNYAEKSTGPYGTTPTANRMKFLWDTMEGSQGELSNIENWCVLFAFHYRKNERWRATSGNIILRNVRRASNYANDLRELVKQDGVTSPRVLDYIKKKVVPYLETLITEIHGSGDLMTALLPTPLENRRWKFSETRRTGVEYRNDLPYFFDLGRAWVFGRVGVKERPEEMREVLGALPRETSRERYRELLGLIRTFGAETAINLGLTTESELKDYGLLKKIARLLVERALRKLLRARAKLIVA